MQEIVDVLTKQVKVWQTEMQEVDVKLVPLLRRKKRLQDQIGAAESLISTMGGKEPTTASSHSQGEAFTPTDQYWKPLLSTLIEMGGKTRGEDVVNKVGEKMKNVLRPVDYERLPQSMEIRWRNRVNWQRFNMVKRGLLRSDSPRGVWEITPAGRDWFSRQK